MDKTETEMIIPGGKPAELENLSFSEADLTDSGGGQPLFPIDICEKSKLLLSSRFRQRSNSFSEFRPSNLTTILEDKASLLVSTDTSMAKNEKGEKWTEVTTKKISHNSPELPQGKRRQTKLDGYWLSASPPTSKVCSPCQ